MYCAEPKRSLSSAFFSSGFAFFSFAGAGAAFSAGFSLGFSAGLLSGAADFSAGFVSEDAGVIDGFCVVVDVAPFFAGGFSGGAGLPNKSSDELGGVLPAGGVVLAGGVVGGGVAGVVAGAGAVAGGVVGGVVAAGVVAADGVVGTGVVAAGGALGGGVVGTGGVVSVGAAVFPGSGPNKPLGVSAGRGGSAGVVTAALGGNCGEVVASGRASVS
jgi:hypothetical protein